MRKFLDKSIPAFDGLRGIACLAVFLVHFQQKAKLHATLGPFQLERLLENGNTGVALFFALSGFLLSLPFWQASRNGSTPPTYLRYLLKRAARILPAFYLCLTALIVDNQLWQDRDKWEDILLHYLFLFNFSDSAIFRISQPFWTLAVEMQFYLMLPILFAYASKIGEQWRLLFISVLALSAYLYHYSLLQQADQVGRINMFGQQLAPTSPVLTYSLLAHIPHFLLGVVSAHAYLVFKQNEYMCRYKLNCGTVFWLSSLFVLLILSTLLDDWLKIPYGRYNLPYVPLLIAALLVTVPFCMLANRILCFLPIKAIGVISYGVYLFHLPCQNVTARFMEKLNFAVTEWWGLFFVISLLLTIVVSTFSFLAVERPIIKLIKGNRQKS